MTRLGDPTTPGKQNTRGGSLEVFSVLKRCFFENEKSGSWWYTLVSPATPWDEGGGSFEPRVKIEAKMKASFVDVGNGGTMSQRQETKGLTREEGIGISLEGICEKDTLLTASMELSLMDSLYSCPALLDLS